MFVDKSVAVKAAKTLAGVAAFFSIAVGTIGCDSDDVAIVGGTIGVVAGVIAIDHATDHHHDRPRCRGGYVNRCYYVRDRWGNPHRDCSHREWDSCATRYAATGGFELAADSALAKSVGNPAVNNVAAKYNLPLESAERLTTALQSAAAGKKDALNALGLSDDEMSRVARYAMPSDAALDKVAANLALSRSMAKNLVQQLMNDTKAQMADVNSAAWTACKSTGKWKTDANGGTCKSLDWEGCSPETGASICASVN